MPRKLNVCFLPSNLRLTRALVFSLLNTDNDVMAKVKVKTKKKIPEQSLGKKIVKVLVNYFTTQFILMIIVGFAAWGILVWFKVQYAILLAILIAILSVIPHFGMALGSITAAIVAIFDKVVFVNNAPAIVEGILLLLALFVLNKIVDFLLAPIFLGAANKVNPLIIFFAVILGTLTFGLVGAILAVPVTLVAITVWQHFYK